MLLEKQKDLFISYASEDKETVARPLAEALREANISVWFDEFEILLGDSLRKNIEEGLSTSQHGLVILSHNFFRKEWPQKELNGLFALESLSEESLKQIVTGLEKIRAGRPKG